MTFKIKEAREKAGLSQKELAEIIGVAPNTFHGYESGKHDPKSFLLVDIAKACHVSVDFLLGLEECESVHTIAEVTALSLSPEALEIAAAFDKADPKSQDMVRLALAEYMAPPAAKREEDAG